MPTSATLAPDQAESGLIEKFRRMSPSAYSGHGGVEKAERWKRQVEKILDVLNCLGEQKVRLGPFMLNGEAKHWWNSVKQCWRETWTEATWENFLVAFDEKCFPISVRERKEVEFIKLQQGRITVEQYAAKFVELSRYVPHIINTETCKARKFERGLRISEGE
ncbi:uncharacterized protein LOC105420398 [Amborella trichopoda]|uniref:uncharacterized protein LOC105420398 n=1 Tax=Amborella trichopoda TaxID=13333 RepID=UPI0005D423B7|nr:uncharacterized protein LOC105420398 [Amborella trichopoda]|eukprot:XP_011622158.1 uncharacterized protein LOC105420398 [Amborella trichopoda]